MKRYKHFYYGRKKKVDRQIQILAVTAYAMFTLAMLSQLS